MWLQALKDREEAVRNGKLTTIVFIRDKNAKGQEVRALGRGTHALHVNFAAVVMATHDLVPARSDHACRCQGTLTMGTD